MHDVNPGRRDPYRLHFADERLRGDNALLSEKEMHQRWEGKLGNRKARYMNRARKKIAPYKKLTREVDFETNYYADPEEEEYYGENAKAIGREWKKDVEAEFAEESFNPGAYSERNYRPGWEGGMGFPRSGNYGHYGES